jgi:hypothetical protein
MAVKGIRWTVFRVRDSDRSRVFWRPFVSTKTEGGSRSITSECRSEGNCLKRLDIDDDDEVERTVVDGVVKVEERNGKWVE